MSSFIAKTGIGLIESISLMGESCFAFLTRALLWIRCVIRMEYMP